MLSHSALKEALASPQAALDAIDKIESERKLFNFVRNGWEALEPAMPFVSGWAVEAICEHLQAVTEGEVKRLLINVPPGCTKSLTTSVFFPAWEWGARGLSHYRYILAAHEQTLATRDNVRSRDLMKSEWFQSKWGQNVGFKKDENGKEYYVNAHTGWRKSSSVNSGLTGYRGDRLILDDPHSVKKADSEAYREDVLRWFSETLPSRLNDADNSAIIVIMQRVHQRDVSGLILAEELGYDHLVLPMEYEPDRCCYTRLKPKYITAPKKELVVWDREKLIWRPVDSIDHSVLQPGLEHDLPAEERYKADPREEYNELLWDKRFSRPAVDALKKALRAHGGDYAVAGQLQQRPAPRGGGMFKEEDWQFVDRAPAGGVAVRGWDLAGTDAVSSKTAAYTACCKMKIVNDVVYILDVDRKQASPANVEKMIKAKAQMDGLATIQDLPQDPAQAGKAQVLAFGKLLHGYKFKFSLESGSKEDRAVPLAAQVEIQNVYLVRGHWNADFIKEGSLFPNGQYKDQIDAATRAYQRCLSLPKVIVGTGGGIVESD